MAGFDETPVGVLVQRVKQGCFRSRCYEELNGCMVVQFNNLRQI